MAKRSISLELGLDPCAASRAARSAVAGLGWEIQDQGPGRLVAMEDPAGLGCHVWPVEAEISWSGSESHTTVTVDCKVPGRGPIQNRQLANRMLALCDRLTQG